MESHARRFFIYQKISIITVGFTDMLSLYEVKNTSVKITSDDITGGQRLVNCPASFSDQGQVPGADVERYCVGPQRLPQVQL